MQGAVGSVDPLQNLTLDTTGGNITFGAGVTLTGEPDRDPGRDRDLRRPGHHHGQCRHHQRRLGQLRGRAHRRGQPDRDPGRHGDLRRRRRRGRLDRGRQLVGLRATSPASIFTSTSSLDYGGTASFYAAGSLSFAGPVGLDSPTPTPGRMNLGSLGAIQFSSAAPLNLGSATLSVAQATDVTFGGGFTAGAAALEDISDALVDSSASTVQSLDVNAAQFRLLRRPGHRLGRGGHHVQSDQFHRRQRDGHPFRLVLQPHPPAFHRE